MRQGFAALTSAVIISIVVMTIVFSVSFAGYFVRGNTSDSYFKETANWLAESCVNVAMLKLKQDSSYAGNENISINTDTCNIRTIQTDGSNKIIQTQAIYERATANFKVTVNSDIAVVSWEELATL